MSRDFHDDLIEMAERLEMRGNTCFKAARQFRESARLCVELEGVDPAIAEDLNATEEIVPNDS